MLQKDFHQNSFYFNDSASLSDNSTMWDTVFFKSKIKSHGKRSLAGYSPWSCKEADTTEHAPTNTHTHSVILTITLEHSFADQEDVPQTSCLNANKFTDFSSSYNFREKKLLANCPWKLHQSSGGTFCFGFLGHGFYSLWFLFSREELFNWTFINMQFYHLML